MCANSELWAAAMAALTFATPHGGAFVLFVDNKAAVGCLVKGFSGQHDLNVLTGGLSVCCAITGTGLLVKYVRSKLNLADAPSRGCTGELNALGAHRVPAITPGWDLTSDEWLPRRSDD